MKNKLYVLVQNILNKPSTWMANYLRRKGWIAFYLEPQARQCNNECWLKLYLAEQKRET